MEANGVTVARRWHDVYRLRHEARCKLDGSLRLSRFKPYMFGLASQGPFSEAGKFARIQSSFAFRSRLNAENEMAKFTNANISEPVDRSKPIEESRLKKANRHTPPTTAPAIKSNWSVMEIGLLFTSGIAHLLPNTC